MPRRPNTLAVLAELHSALAGTHAVDDGHELDVPSFMLGVASALAWTEGASDETPLERMRKVLQMR